MPKEPPPPATEQGDIDYYSMNITRIVTDPAGKPKQALSASVLTHFKNDNRTELQQPILTLFHDPEPPWVIRSETATLTGDGSTVYLHGDVLITREATGNAGPVRMETRNVKVEPDNEYAETQEFVHLTSPPDELSGTGMQVHFGENLRVTILSDVRRKHDVRR